MKKVLRKRFTKNPNTIEAYACLSARCSCNPAYCAATWSSMVEPLSSREYSKELHLVEVGVSN